MSKRRELVFDDQDMVLADVRQLATGEVQVAGSHSFAEIVRHLALTNNMVTGKTPSPPPLPWYMRLMMPFMRSSILNGPVKPGFKLPVKMEAFFWPDDPVEIGEAVAQLAASIENYKATGPLDVHPVFGRATKEQVDRLTLKHAAMHLSFVRPI